MTTLVSGKNMDIGDSLRAHAEGRIDESVQKYFNGGYSSQVTIEKEGSGYRADCSIHLDVGVTLQTTGNAQEVYASFDQAADRLTKRLRRYKRKLKDHRTSAEQESVLAASYILASPDQDEELEEDFHPTVIAESNIKTKEMSVSEAVMEMDLAESPLVIFKNAAHGRINIVYRRPDGHIGWIDPTETA